MLFLDRQVASESFVFFKEKSEEHTEFHFLSLHHAES